MAKNLIQLTAIRDTPQECAGLKNLVLTRGQMAQWGLLLNNLCTEELSKLRRCQNCRRMLLCVCCVILRQLLRDSFC